MLHAVIMAGGSGTRFWPKSRRDRPKQLLNLHGEGTMLQQTLARVASLVPAGRTWIITGEDQAAAVRAQAARLDTKHVIAEPCPRDTAPCVGLAALYLRRADPNAIMIVMPADHVIHPEELFLNTLRSAVEIVEREPTAFVTFGVKPTHAETGYGYIEQGEQLSELNGIPCRAVRQFREKPDRPTAEQFLAAGNFAWNSGIFVWTAKAILDAIAQHQPDLRQRLSTIDEAIGTPDEQEVIAREFPLMAKIPIDKAVMEHADNVRVLEVVYRWSDVGDWRALAEFLPRDEHGNAIQGPVLPLETSDCIIIGDEDGMIATLGVKDLIIVQSGGATLVARKEDLDKLKALVQNLENAGFGFAL